MKIFISSFFLCIIALTGSRAQIITTIAGNGILGFSGDGGLATAAEFKYPFALAVDKSGNIYIADKNNNRIRKISISTGKISTIAGNGTGSYSGDGGAATSAELYYPSAVSLDTAGNIYIADFYNNRIRKITVSTGIITTVAGDGNANYSGDGGAATAAELNNPSGVALDASGNIYIVDQLNNRIRKVNTATGIITTIAGNGTFGYTGDGGLATAAELSNPTGIALDAAGNIYIADTYSEAVRKITISSGKISTVAGNGIQGYSGDGGAATSAELSLLTGVFIDSLGNLFIADAGNMVIRKVNTTGTIDAFAGNGTGGFAGDGGLATAAELTGPSGMVAIPGFVYIADQSNNRIRKVTMSTVGINEIHSSDAVLVYPNPSSSKFTIKITDSHWLMVNCKIEIYNMLGERIYTASLNPSNGGASNSLPSGGSGWAIDLSDKPAGIYLYRIINADGTLIATDKITLN